MTMNLRSEIDEELLAADLASGFYTQKKLAERHGVSVSLVGKIARGQRRPGIAQQVERIRYAVVARADRRLAGLVEPALDVLAAALRGEATPTALRAAQEVLNRALGKAGAKRPPQTVKQELNPLKLSMRLQRMIAAELGGPTDDASWTVPPPITTSGPAVGALWGPDASKQSPPIAQWSPDPGRDAYENRPEPGRDAPGTHGQDARATGPADTPGERKPERVSKPKPAGPAGPRPARRPKRKAEPKRVDSPAAAPAAEDAAGTVGVEQRVATAPPAGVHPVRPPRSNAKFIIAVRARHRRLRDRGLV